MTIIKDRDNNRIVNTETGEYMTWILADRETMTEYFTLHVEGGEGIFGAEISTSGYYKDSLRKSITTQFILKKCWIPTGRSESPNYFKDSNPLIDRLFDFLKVYRYGPHVEEPVGFELIDARDEATYTRIGIST